MMDLSAHNNTQLTTPRPVLITMMIPNTVTAVLLLLAASASAFAPKPVVQQRHTSSTSLEIGGFMQGFFGKKDAEITDTVFFDVSIDGEPAGRINIGLYGSTVPKTADNFKQLCTGKPGFGYKGSMFHRIIPGYVPSVGSLLAARGIFSPIISTLNRFMCQGYVPSVG
jgi:hypothetical protein